MDSEFRFLVKFRLCLSALLIGVSLTVALYHLCFTRHFSQVYAGIYPIQAGACFRSCACFALSDWMHGDDTVPGGEGVLWNCLLAICCMDTLPLGWIFVGSVLGLRSLLRRCHPSG